MAFWNSNRDHQRAASERLGKLTVEPASCDPAPVATVAANIEPAAASRDAAPLAPRASEPATPPVEIAPITVNPAPARPPAVVRQNEPDIASAYEPSPTPPAPRDVEQPRNPAGHADGATRSGVFQTALQEAIAQEAREGDRVLELARELEQAEARREKAASLAASLTAYLGL